ncbi:MAG TPA: hypothetical protein VN731_02140 [Rhodanobacter sp.]|nr:hypothetical protein [Rhodanobacter sp.]
MHEFIESSVFAKYVYDYLTEEEYAAMQWHLSHACRCGRSDSWLRRLSQDALGCYRQGKRGGARVIYYEVTQAGQIWLLAIYAKNQQANLPARVIRLIKDHMVKS